MEEDSRYRYGAVKQAEPGRIEVLERSLRHPDSEVRWDAVLDLESTPGERATDLLIEALFDPDFVSIRWRAGIALGVRGDSRAVAPLARALSRDDHFSVREEAAEALGRIGDPSAIPFLIQALHDRDEGVRLRALRALVDIGEPAKDSLARVLTDQERSLQESIEEILRRIAARRR